MEDNMAAPTTRWFIRQLNQNGSRFYYTGSNIFMTNKAAESKIDDTLAKNPYYEKYASKINSLQQQDPQKVAATIEELSGKKKPKKISDVIGMNSSKASVQPKVKHESWTQYMQAKRKTLDALMKTELLKEKTRGEIEQIWHEYFKDKYVISAILPSKMYQQLEERAKEFPTFLFPLPRGEGYEFMLCQFSGNEAHFTSLINYQTHGENAPECLTLVYYPDLAEEKEIVLMKGDYDKDTLNGQEARCLVNQVMLYYVEANERKSKLLERFSNEPEKFQHMDLIQELERIELA